MAKKELVKDQDFLNPEEKSGVGKAIRQSKVIKDAMKKVRESLRKALQKIGQVLLKALANPYVLIALAIIIVILLFVSFIQAFLNVPGDMQARLKAFFDKKFEGWHWNNGAVDKFDDKYSDIIDVINYLEDMEYDVISYGFVKPNLDAEKKYTMDELIGLGYQFNTYEGMQEQGFTYSNTDNLYHLFNMETGEIYSENNGHYYNGLGIEIDNYSNERVTKTIDIDGVDKDVYVDNFGMIRSTEEYNENGKGKLLKISSKKEAKDMYGLIRTYLLSDYRIYSLKNYDQKIANMVVNGFKTVFGGNQDAWSRGLIKLYHAQNGISSDVWNFSDVLEGDSAHITRDTLEIKDGYFNNSMKYKIEGWAPRYGLSLEFLLSLHLGTMAPDLVYAVLQNFDTEVQVYLNDSKNGTVSSSYLELDTQQIVSDKTVTLEIIKKALEDSDHPIIAANIQLGDNGALQWMGTITLTRAAVGDLFRANIGLTSPWNCTGGSLDYVVLGYDENKEYDELKPTGGEYHIDDEYWTNYFSGADSYGDWEKYEDVLDILYGYKDSDLDEIDFQYKKDAVTGAALNYNRKTAIISSLQENNKGYKKIKDDETTEYNSVIKETYKSSEVYNYLNNAVNASSDAMENALTEYYAMPAESIEIKDDGSDYVETTCNGYIYKIVPKKKTASWEVFLDSENNVIDEATYLDNEETSNETEINYYSYRYDVYEVGTCSSDGSKSYYGNGGSNNGENQSPVLVDGPFIVGVSNENNRVDKSKGYSLISVYYDGNDFILESNQYEPTENDEEGEYRITTWKKSSFDDNLYLANFIWAGESFDSKNANDSNAMSSYPAIRISIDEGNDQGKIEYNYKLQSDIGGGAFIYNFEGSDEYPVEDTILERTFTLSEIKDRFNNGMINSENTAIYKDTFYVNVAVRDKTLEELIEAGLYNEDGTPNANGGNCFGQCQGDSKYKPCRACKTYVKRVIKGLHDVSDQDYSFYTPYIARVVGSWFRNTYFIIPKNEDKAISTYADKEYHREFNAKEAYGNTVEFVDVDLDYLADSGEYWSAYEMKIDPDTNEETSEYQLFVLKPNGITSNTKMEDFLSDGMIDGEQATINGNVVTGYASKKDAENAGWAFVKKAKMTGILDFATDSYVMNKEDNGIDTNLILWSAYVFDKTDSSMGRKRVLYSDDNDEVNEVYKIIYHTSSTNAEGENIDMDRADSESEESGYFYEIQRSNNVTQEEDAQRGPTNPLVKYLFKYRQYYIYDGTDKTALAISHDKYRIIHGYSRYIRDNIDNTNEFYNNKEFVPEVYKDIEAIGYSDISDDGNFYHFKGLLGENSDGLLYEYYGFNWKDDVILLLDKYGRGAIRETYNGSFSMTDSMNDKDLAEQWLEWQLDMFYMDKYGLDLYSYYQTDADEVKSLCGRNELLLLKVDPRDPDLISTISIEKSSLNSFTILENTGTIDAEYQYRDFKELIVELNYFDKEDLSEKNPEIFTWILPETPVAANWPILPVDKQDVEYGTLIHSHQTYLDLGIQFNSNQDGSGSNVDAGKVYWIGDSWTVGLVESNLLEGTINGLEVVNDRILAKIGANAYSLPGSPNPPSDSSGIIIALGKNDPFDSGINAIKNLANNLSTSYSDIPIYILKLSYYGTDPYVDGAQVITKDDVDSFNQKMQEYCSGNDKVSLIDPTKSINDNGVVKSEYNEPDNIHLNSEGYTAWYNDILSEISGNSSSNNSSTNPISGGQSRRSQSGTDFGVKEVDENASDNPEHADRIVSVNGIDYLQFNQSGYYGDVNVEQGSTQVRTDSGDSTLSGMGCGIYSISAMLSGYEDGINPKAVCEEMHTKIGTSAFNNSSNRYSSTKEMAEIHGIGGDWHSDNYEQLLKEAFSAGKPVIFNVGSANGGSIWHSAGDGHFICFLGVSQDGTVYTADSSHGGGSRIEAKIADDFDGAISAIVNGKATIKSGIFIPEKAPTGVKTSNSAEVEVLQFQGYEKDQFVASPVTGKVLEYGVHLRTNVYTLEKESVGYMIVEAMSSDYFSDEMFDNDFLEEYKESTTVSEDNKDLFDSPAKALNLFYKEYKDVCTGYRVMIDGFNVDLSIEGGEYSQNKVKSLYNTKEQTKRDDMEIAKDEAPFLVSYGVDENPPTVDESLYNIDVDNESSNSLLEPPVYKVTDEDSLKGYYVKEGKYIGKTITKDVNPDEANPDPVNPDNPDSENENGEEIPDHTDYMRIIIKNLDYSLEENVEKYFYRPEAGPASSMGIDFDMMFFFWIPYESGEIGTYEDYVANYGSGPVDDVGCGPTAISYDKDAGYAYSIAIGVAQWTSNSQGLNSIGDDLIPKLLEIDPTTFAPLSDFSKKDAYYVRHNVETLKESWYNICKTEEGWNRMLEAQMKICYENEWINNEDYPDIVEWAKNESIAFQGYVFSVINWGNYKYNGATLLSRLSSTAEEKENLNNLGEACQGYIHSIPAYAGNGRWDSQTKLAIDMINGAVSEEEVIKWMQTKESDKYGETSSYSFPIN